MHGICEIQCQKRSEERNQVVADRNNGPISLEGSHGNLILKHMFSENQEVLADFYDHGCWCGATNTKRVHN